ncbi:MAG: exodeoxyribonuclease VII large subunit [Anaerolineae bacterium]|nr:exodeoxyribonuclease VII large subunit [Anaerolineae bacterium]
MATIARQCSPAAAIARLHRANRCVAGTIECSYNLPMFGRIREFDSTWSVSDITQYIKELFDVDLRLRDVAVEGEISNFTQARSGHLYFTLKDEQAQLRCVMWRSQAERLRFDPQNGDAVVARGRVSVYEASGAYQLYADHLEPVGRGNLALAFEQLKQRLEAEGLFDTAHKQPIPSFPRKIGIVTSADAAALRDILNVLRRRYPLVEVLIAPTLVQGNDAPPNIVRALTWLDGRNDIDTIIVARGGGSMEDLWAFNDEDVARAIFAAKLPIISGVGHEIDFTIADFVADLRAPTPSAAAELAVPDIAELRQAVDALSAMLHARVINALDEKRRTRNALTRTLTQLNPHSRVQLHGQRLENLFGRMQAAMNRRIDTQRNRVTVATARLATVSPLATLERGYAVVRSAEGRLITTVNAVTPGESLAIQVADGTFGAEVTDTP